MTTKDKLSIDELIRLNPNVDPGLVDSANAAIEKIKEIGFRPAGYRLSRRRDTLIEKPDDPVCKERLPRRHY
jgi:hypothetical protein